MKKITFFISVLITGISASAFAQTEKFSFCKSYCGKQWTLVATEEFGVEGDPAENMQKDQVAFLEDGQVKITLFGKTTEGKWVIDNTQTYISITNGKTKEKTFLKAIKNEGPNEMVLEYQDPKNLVKTKMVYEKTTDK
jgi:hypothetical protein